MVHVIGRFSKKFSFRTHHLNYRFPVSEPGRYPTAYFTEPWHGTGGGEKTDCEGFRIFDVAVNGKTLIDDGDIWAKSGHDGAFRRVVEAEAVNGELLIDFPEVKSGQAIICAIAIAKKGEVEKRPMLPLVKASMFSLGVRWVPIRLSRCRKKCCPKTKIPVALKNIRLKKRW